MEDFLYKLILVVIIVAIIIGCMYMTPFGRALINSVDYVNNKIDEVTSYSTKKEVEDTCRAMIASYTSDKLVYDQYKDSTSKEQRSWADQAKMRANKTAASYNNYILKNKYVWSDNVPSDIKMELGYIE